MFQRKKSKIQRNASKNSGNNDLPVLSELFNLPISDFLSMEVEKERAESRSPNGVLEDYLRSAESETSSSKATSSGSQSQQPDSKSSAWRWRGLAQLLRTKSSKHLSSMNHPLSALKHSFRSTSMREASLRMAQTLPLPATDPANSQNFTFSHLQAATHNFSTANLIGKGGYAEVYRGCLENGQRVAIKRLARGTPDEKIKDFLSELGMMAHVFHPNITRLIGYGVEGGLYLVLDLSSHGSLASLLHGSREKLTWGVRYRIAVGAARGLHYLHEGCQRRIIHRDIKAANILLTENFNPKICDFGLAKWLPEQWTHLTVSKFEGTFGYLAPECLMHGIVDDKTDVFAFGVLVLELLTGRRALDYSQQSLVIWAKPLLKKKKIRDLIDPSLGDIYDSKQINLLALVASSCLRHSSMRRPCMSQVVQLLEVDGGSSEGLKRLRKPFFPKAAEENKSLKYLNALNRHKQVALEL